MIKYAILFLCFVKITEEPQCPCKRYQNAIIYAASLSKEQSTDLRKGTLRHSSKYFILKRHLKNI